MAPLRKVLVLYLVLFYLASVLLCASCLESSKFVGRRKMLVVNESDDEEPIVKPKKKTSDTLSSKNQAKLIKTNLSSKNQTKLIKTNLSSKNQTKLPKTPYLLSKNQTKINASPSTIKTKTNSTKSKTFSSSDIGGTKIGTTKIELKKLNSTTKIKKLNSKSSKTSNSTKPTTKKILDLTPRKNTTTKKTQISEAEKKNVKAQQSTEKKKPNNTKPEKESSQSQQSWLDLEDETDLVSEFSDLATKFQKTLIPDLERMSITSKAYLNQANKQITKGFKPIVGNKYAPTVASLVSFAFILVPLLLLSLIFNRIKAYFSLQKLLIFIQVYLSIYFAILCLSSLVTGLEPLRFCYATSQSTYICLQVLQTLGYVLYLLLLLLYLIFVFSTNCGLGSKMLGLAQTFVGFAVGLHYYVAVFHRVVLRQPPKTNWKVHGIYATCFFLVCLCARAERRKKAYLEDGGEGGKKN